MDTIVSEDCRSTEDDIDGLSSVMGGGGDPEPVPDDSAAKNNPTPRGTYNRGRCMIYSGIAATAALFAAATYFFTSTAEDTQFQSDFESLARETAAIADSRANTLFGQMDSLAIAIASANLANDNSNGDFPNVTIPHLDLRTDGITELTGADMIMFVPFVKAEDKAGFEQYATENQEWLVQDYVSLYKRPCHVSNDGNRHAYFVLTLHRIHRNTEDGMLPT